MRRLAALCAAGALLSLGAPPVARAETFAVRMKGGGPSPYYFTPHYRVITVGDSITWTNDTAEGHTVTGYKDAGERWYDSSPKTQGFCNDGVLTPDDCVKEGESVSFTFQEPETYDYFCKIHGTESVHPDESKGAQAQQCGQCGRVVVKTKTTPTPPPTRPATTTPKPTQTGTASPTGSATASPTGTTTGPAATGTPTLGGDGVAAPGGGGGGGRVALALVTIVALSGAGYATWRRFITRR